MLASVTYSTPQQAAYARDKIHGFEYPPGQHMIVRPDYSENTQQIQQIPPPFQCQPNQSFPSLMPGGSNLSKADIELLAENVKQATALLKAHTGISGISPALYDPHYCSAKLPPPKKFDNEEPSGAEARLFVVFNPSIPERYAIKDVFGRFGKITDIFLLAGKNVGYISYNRKESVNEAIAVSIQILFLTFYYFIVNFICKSFLGLTWARVMWNVHEGYGSRTKAWFWRAG